MNIQLRIPKVDLTPAQAKELVTRLAMTIIEVTEHPDIWPGPIEIRAELIHNDDAWPDMTPNQDRRSVMAIPHEDNRSLWVFVNDYYVTNDGEVLFE